MKKNKLGLALVLLVAMVTGGTYGAWTYYEGAVKSVSSTVQPTMTVKTDQAAKGAIAFGEDVITVSVEPETDKQDYTAKLVTAGKVVATYTATNNNNAEFKGISATVELIGNSYNGNTIFTLGTNTFSTTEKSLTITDKDLNLSINKFVLATKAEADEFATALKNTSIKITVSEKA